MNAGIVPSDWLAVEVSARTLIFDVVVPAIGEMVGAMVGGRTVAVGADAAVTGNVAVTNAGNETAGVDSAASQPVQNNRILRYTLIFFCFTPQLYPKTGLYKWT